MILRKEQKSFPHWRGTLTSKIAMREIPDPKSTMEEWYNIKSFPVFKKTGKLFPCFFAILEHFSTMREIISLFLRENHSLFFAISEHFFTKSENHSRFFLQIYH